MEANWAMADVTIILTHIGSDGSCGRELVVDSLHKVKSVAQHKTTKIVGQIADQQRCSLKTWSLS